MNAIRSDHSQHFGIVPDGKRPEEDTDWIESDLSGLDNYEPYEWQEGLPVKFIAETGKIEIGF